jgi:hypothetical protein
LAGQEDCDKRKPSKPVAQQKRAAIVFVRDEQTASFTGNDSEEGGGGKESECFGSEDDDGADGSQALCFRRRPQALWSEDHAAYKEPDSACDGVDLVCAQRVDPTTKHATERAVRERGDGVQEKDQTERRFTHT